MFFFIFFDNWWIKFLFECLYLLTQMSYLSQEPFMSLSFLFNVSFMSLSCLFHVSLISISYLSHFSLMSLSCLSDIIFIYLMSFLLIFWTLWFHEQRLVIGVCFVLYCELMSIFNSMLFSGSWYQVVSDRYISV